MRTIDLHRLLLAIAIAAAVPSLSFCQTLEVRVSLNNDDAEEASSGAMNLNNGTLRLGQQKWVGLRFRNVGVPQGATVLGAYLELTSAGIGLMPTQLTIFGQAHDSAPTFGNTNFDISNRPRTAASVLWSDVDIWLLAQTYGSPDISEIVQELVNRPGWSTASELNILIRSDDLTGSRVLYSYNGSQANAALLHVEYTTSASSTTPTIDRLYVERYAARKAGSANAWQTINLSLSPYNVPANKVVEIAIANSNSTAEQWAGVRAVGSSLNRRLQLHEAESGGLDAVVMHVQTDANSNIEIYASSTSSVTFYVLGYWTTGSYSEKIQSFTVSSSFTWQDRNLGGYGVGANQVAEIVMTNSDPANERVAGVRSKGSSLSRIVTLHEAQGGGIDAASMFVQTNKSSDAVIQAYASDTSDITFYVVGYWTRPPGKFTETFTNLGVPTSANTWQDKSLSSAGVPAKAVAEIQLVNTEAAAENSLGVRENNSSNDRRLTLHEAENGGGDLARTHVTADSTSVVEWYSQTTDPTRVDLLLSGYWETAAGNLLVVASNKQSPSSQELTRLSALEGWGYVVGLIDDDDPQSSYDAAFPFYNLLVVPLEANAEVGAKISGASLGIASEHASLVSDFGFSSASAATSAANLSIVDTTHYITSPFAAGSLSILNANQPVTTLSGTLAKQRQAPGQWGAGDSLVTLEAGARRYNGGLTAGRRVQLPWGGAGFSILTINSNGAIIAQRSLQWATALRGWWKYDESTGSVVADSSGNQSNGTLASGMTFDSSGVSNGKINRGLAFNGSSNYAAVAAAPSLDITGAITLSAWIRPDAIGSSYLFTKGENSSYYLRLNSNGSVTLGNGASWQVTSSANAVTAGAWRQVAATYDSAAGKAVLYVDGVAVKTQTGLSGAFALTGNDLVIGANNAHSGGFFTGKMDDLRVYNYALAGSEITALKATGNAAALRIVKWIEVQ